jgi:NAD(P)-dependent dehydrogenase (short-subunit alcohol dehydrogenase family)
MPAPSTPHSLAARLVGHRAIVIGGGSGIGLASALALADAGAAVTIAGRTREKLDAARHASGDRLEVAVLDASREDDVRGFFAAVPPFDHLVLCANAGGTIGPFAGLDGAAMRTYFDNKLWAYINVLRIAPTAQRPGGSITLVNGAASRLAAATMGALAIVNGGLDALVRPLAVELAPTRVNAVAPGVIDTPYWDKLNEAQRASLYDLAAKSVPVGRVGSADDVAEAVLFLTINTFVTGVVIDVDGGRRLTPNASQ